MSAIALAGRIVKNEIARRVFSRFWPLVFYL